MAIDKGRHCHVQCPSCRLLHQIFPFIHIEDGLIAFGIQGEFPGLDLDGLTVGAEQEVQGGNILRDRNVAVIRKDGRQCIALLHVLRGWRAGG